MELYTLDDKFIPRKLIDPFISAIWTERYYEAGDFQLTVLSPSILADELARGRFLAMSGSKEIMVIETRSIEKNVLTVTGSSLVKFFNEREAIFENIEYDPTDPSALAYADYADDTLTAGPFLSSVIVRTLILPEPFSDFYAGLNLEWAKDVIRGLRIGSVDDNGDIKQLTFPLGPIYDGIVKFATEQKLGFKLYLESASAVSGAYDLVFYIYRGVNRTSNQDVHRLIRMSPDMDSLLDAKELFTWEHYKNIIYVTYKNEVSVHYSHHYDPKNFKRRVIRVDAPADANVDPDKIPAFRQQVAWNAFIQNAQTSVVDGQVTTVAGHKFTKDYYLGDVIELKGWDNVIEPAQVVEHIRSQDQYGFKEYPSFNLLDPALFDFDKDLGDGGVLGETDDPIYTVDPPATPRLIFSYQPSTYIERVIGGLTYDGERIPLWVDFTDNYNLTPQMWTPDHQKLLIHRLNVFTEVTGEYYNEARLSYSLMKPDGSDKKQLNEEVIGTGEGGEGWDTSERAGLWSNSVGDDGDKYLYVTKRRGGANPLVARKVDIYQNTMFPVSDLSIFLAAEMFPDNQKEEFPFLVPSPDGSKLYIKRPGLTSSYTFVSYHTLVNSDGSDFGAIDLDIDPAEFDVFLKWSADSTKLYNCLDQVRYISYDVASGVVTTPSLVQEDALGAVYISPNNSKIAWTETTYADGGEGGERWLFIGNLDGSSATLLYHTPAYANPLHKVEDADQTILMLHTDLAWSFDSTKVAIIDRRPQSPIWIIDVNTGVATKVYDGDGWDIIPEDPGGGGDDGGGGSTPAPTKLPYIRDLMMFND